MDARARVPDHTGFAHHDGHKIYYEVFGEGDPTIVLIHGIPLAYSRSWKGQVPTLARNNRVVVMDLLGNGKSDRPTDPAAYALQNTYATVQAVLAAAGVGRRIVIGLSLGASLALIDAAFHPEEVAGVALLAPSVPVIPPPPGWDGLDITRFDDPVDETTVWGRVRRAFMRDDYESFVEFFMDQVFIEPHTASVQSDMLEYARETNGQVLEACFDGLGAGKSTWEERAERMAGLLQAVKCPSLVVAGTEDKISPVETAQALAAMIGSELILIEGAGHGLAKSYVRMNLALRDFVDRLSGHKRNRRWSSANNGQPRALYLSSPIGLGHVHRDLAIARELRARRPDLRIDWLAQNPVSRVLTDHEEIVHPASGALAAELKAFEQGCEGHGLNAFQAFRRMDDVMLTNFHVFHDLVAEGGYDVVIADEAWEVDLMLHDNPELKRAPLVWLTDIIGGLPAPGVPEGDLPLIHDLNAMMVDHRARYPWLRDRSLFVGNPQDLIDESFGPGLPNQIEWTKQNFQFTGYVLGFDPMSDDDKQEARERFGYLPDQQVCIVTAGGSVAGESLLRKVTASYPILKKGLPGLRLIAVTGPSISADSLDAPAGVEVVEYLPKLSDRLGACDVAVVQGGLGTTMELTANRTPFVYVPLELHFEQQVGVPTRLANYGAGRRLDWADLDADSLSAALSSLVNAPADYKPVESDGAARAAAEILPLIGAG